MSNIVLRTDVVNSTVIPGLTSVSDKIKTAQSKCNSLQSLLPSSFPNTAQVSKLSYSLNNSVSEVLAAKKTISQKVEYASNIENKHSSKTSSLLAKLGGAAGAIFGAASGGVLGAVAGGIIGSKVAEPIVKTGAKIAKGAVSAVKGLFTKVGNGIKKAATAIKNTGAKVVKGFVSGAKKVVSSVGSGIKKAASAIKNTGAKIVKGFVSGVKKVGKAVSDGIKKVGAKVCKAVKSFAGGVKKVVSAVGSGIKKVGNFLKNTGAKVVKGFVSGVKKVGKAIGDGLKWAGGKIAQGAKAIAGFATKAAKGIWNGLKAAGKWVWNGLKKVGASLANLAISLVKGVAQFGEALVDGIAMIGGGVASIFTGLYDGFQAIRGAITGKEWKSATKAMWSKGLMPFVSTEYVKGWSNSFYQTGVGKWLDNNAFGWFKSDGIACDIGSAVGYVAGIVVLTIATAGIGTAATGAATAASSTSTAISTGLAAVAATGKAGSKNFNAIKGEDGTFDNVTGAQIAKAVGGSYASGAIEGVAWYYTYGTGADALKGGVGKLANTKVISKLAPTVTKAKMGIQFTKTIANANVNAFATGTEVDWGETMFDATVNAGVAGVYEKFGTQLIKAGGKKMTNFYNAKALAKNSSIQQSVAQDGGFDAGDVVDDVVLNNRQEIIKYTIEKGASKVGGKGVKESYTSVVEASSDLITSAIAAN